MSLSPLRPISILQLLRVTSPPLSLSGFPLVPRLGWFFYPAVRLFGCLFSSIRALRLSILKKMYGFSQIPPILAITSSSISHHRCFKEIAACTSLYLEVSLKYTCPFPLILVHLLLHSRFADCLFNSMLLPLSNLIPTKLISVTENRYSRLLFY